MIHRLLRALTRLRASHAPAKRRRMMDTDIDHTLAAEEA